MSERPNPVEDYIKKVTDEPKPKGPVQSPITEKAFERRRPVFNPMGRVEDINDDEVKVADIRRHPFGLIVIYIQFIVAIVLALGLVTILLPGVMGDSTGANLFSGLLAFVMSILGLIFLVLATRVYQGNQLIITDHNVTQVQQIGLFNRKVSELTMSNVEDVTANTNGIFPTLFNFGILTVETPGEQNNFIFKYCPNPSAYAKALQDARSDYMRHYGHH